MRGSLEVFAGPMFSGKTEALLDRLRVTSRLGRMVRAYKPKIDGRYATNEIVSHKGGRFPAEPVEADGIDGGYDVIGIDEAQFFDPSVVQVVSRLVRKGTKVIVSGLDLTWRGEPFGPMPSLLSLADAVHKLRGTCAKCGGESSRSQRLVSSSDAILVGGAESYEPRCLSCFDPDGVGK